jgi:TatD DNase family protein
VSEWPPAPAGLPAAVADAHCHLDMGSGKSHNSLDLDKNADIFQYLVDTAAEVNVTQMINVGCEVPGARFAIEMAKRYPTIHAAVALHPNEAPRLVEEGGINAFEEAWLEIEQLAQDPGCVAVGETGLDFYRTSGSGLEVQEESFRRHIRLAKKLNKTLMIHDREAHQDILRVVDEEGTPEKVMMHCFSGDAEFAKQCLERGYYLSFAGTVTFKNADSLRAALKVTDQDHILVETDAPFLTPVPHRGAPNAGFLIPHTMRFMAEVRSEDLTELCKAVMANTKQAFGI